MHDLKFALRQLLKNPGFTAMAVLTLALGIGANTAIFSQINELLLRPLPVKQPEKLMALVLINPQGDYSNQNIPYPIVRDYREQSRSFSEWIAYAQTIHSSWQLGDKTTTAYVQLASANFFSALGVVPFLGRGFLPDEDQDSRRGPPVILSYACWQNRFGADPGIIGKTVLLRPPFVEPLSGTVVGVAPAGFSGLEKVEKLAPDCWLPAVLEAQFKKSVQVDFRLVGRLAAGVTREHATAELNVVTRNIAEKYKGAVIPGYEHEGIFPSDLKVQLRYAALGQWGAFKSARTLQRATLLASGVVGLVLLIACANLANLLLARAVNRRKEMAIRLSLGASQARVFRQMLTESLVLALLGGALAVVFGMWGSRLLLAFKPAGVELLVQASLDGRVVAFTLALSVVTGLIFGIAPALQAMRFDPNGALKEETAVLAGVGGRFQVRDVLVVAQVGLCLLLLMGAGLCLRSLLALHSANHGFNVRNTIAAPLTLRQAGATAKTAGPLFDQIIEKVKALPGVRAVSFAESFPLLDGGFGLPVNEIEGYVPRKDEFLVMKFSNVGPDFLETLQIPVQRSSGATLREQGRLVWVNESLVRRYWPGLDPIGKNIGMYEVSGVVKNSRNKNLWEEPEPYVYIQYSGTPQTLSGHLFVRTEGDPGPLLPVLRGLIQAASSDLDVSRIQTMRQVVNKSLVGQRFTLVLMGVFAITALLLASVGIYGVMSFVVTHRTREIGIRMALGAGRRDVLGLILRHGMMLVGVGIVLGLAGALAFTRLLSSLLFGITPTDTMTFVLVCLLVGLVAFVACCLPALRAAKVDPIKALRHE
jgi:putative ABC transport system permease protein